MSSYPVYRPSGVEWLGDVPEHWEVKPLRSPVSFRGGSTPSKSREEFWDGDIPWVSPKDMKRALIADAEDHVTCEALADSACTMLPVHSVLVVVRGMILAHSFPVAITAAPVTINQDMKCLIAHEPLSHRFLYWFLVGAARALVSLCDESAHGTRKLETAALAGFLTPLPPYGEQAAIVDYLERETERIDALVAKKRQLIERLLEYRNALITATMTRGLPPDAARAAGLNPSPRLKPSGVDWLRDVPEHWEVKPLRSWVSFFGGTTPSKSREEFWDGDIPWVSPKDMKRALIADSEDHVTGAALAESACTILPVPSVLVVVRGMILAHSLPVAITTAPVAINQDMKGLMTHEPLSHRFLYWFLVGAARTLVSLSDESAHGTRKLETATLAGFLTPLPPYREQAAITKFLDTQTRRLDALVRRAVSAIERLQEYRTALITAAVTGKIDVRKRVAADGS